MKNYLKIASFHLDRFDKSQNPWVRLVRYELYLIGFVVILTSLTGVILQFLFVIWFLPKEMIVKVVDQIVLQYGSLLFFTNDPLTAIRTSWILVDIIMFFIGSFILIKIKRKIRASMENKIEENEST